MCTGTSFLIPATQHLQCWCDLLYWHSYTSVFTTRHHSLSYSHESNYFVGSLNHAEFILFVYPHQGRRSDFLGVLEPHKVILSFPHTKPTGTTQSSFSWSTHTEVEHKIFLVKPEPLEVHVISFSLGEPIVWEWFNRHQLKPARGQPFWKHVRSPPIFCWWQNSSILENTSFS